MALHPPGWLKQKREPFEVLARRWRDCHCHSLWWGDKGHDQPPWETDIVLKSKRHTFCVAQWYHFWYLPKRNKIFIQSSFICTCPKWAPVQCPSLGDCRPVHPHWGGWAAGEGRNCWPHGVVGIWGVTPSHIWHPASMCMCWWLHLYDILGDTDPLMGMGSRSTNSGLGTAMARGRKELGWVYLWSWF